MALLGGGASTGIALVSLTRQGEDSTKSVYAERLKGLRALSDPIALRKREAELLPSAARALREVRRSILWARLTSAGAPALHRDA